jgi:hypothetical protein
VPPASPGIAASQNNCISVNLNPMAGSLTATALMTNHVANDRISEKVVIQRVFQAIFFPVFFQNPASSGRQSDR